MIRNIGTKMAVVILAGLTFGAVVHEAAAQAAASGAKRCQTPRRFDEFGFHTTMTVSNEGAPCSFPAKYTRQGRNSTGGEAFYQSGSVATEPKHGKVALRFTDTEAYVDYTPTPGYQGTDSFVIRFQPSARSWEVNVTVAP